MSPTIFSEGKQEAERLRRLRKRPIPTLKDFLIGAWNNVLHPAEELDLDGAWYIDLLCEELTLLTIGTLIRLSEFEMADRLLAPYGLDHTRLDARLIETRNLLVNIPPRCTKSTLANVCWPCWEWLIMSWMPHMCISYSQALASEHNDDRRMIIKSPWFAGFEKNLVLSKSLDRITEFQNNQRGKMTGRGLNSGVTGGGGVRLIFDDPNDPNKVESEPIRNKTAKSYKDYSSTRRNNPTLTCIVVIQQRTHQKDVSGEILKEPEGWRIVIIQMEAEEETILEFPLSGRVLHRKPGDLMHESRFPRDEIEKLRRLGSIWAGRFQQKPNATGGSYFQYEKWRMYVDLPPPDRTLLSVDATFDDTPDSDYVSMGVISQCANVREALDADGNKIYESEYYVRAVNKKQRDVVSTMDQMKLMIAEFPAATTRLIENKANGPAIRTIMSETIPGLVPFKTGRESKQERASAVRPILERGDLLIPIEEWAKPALREKGVNSISVADWWALHPPTEKTTADSLPISAAFKEFLEELAMFPNGEYDDHVDMLTQGVIWSEQNKPSSGWTGIGVRIVR
jgi:phage terminase large subunit-like protein